MEKFDETVIQRGKRHLSEGQYVLAHDFIFQHYETYKKVLEDEKIISHENSIELQQLAARSSIKIEDYPKALEILHPLKNQPHPENLINDTWGNLGSAYKNIWVINRKAETGELAKENYLQAFEKTQNYWSGINAASMTLILDKSQTTKVKELVNEVITSVEKSFADSQKKINGEERYWGEATLGEAHILIGNLDKAEEHFDNALKAYKEMSGLNFHLRSSTKKQLGILKAEGIEIPPHILDKFPPFKVVVFTGHMIDRNNRKEERFPVRLEEPVRNEIRKKLIEINPDIGYSGAACGADLIFLEEMLKLNKEVNIILPFAEEDYIKESVSVVGGNWEHRFNEVLNKANSKKFVTKEQYLGDNSLFSFGGEIFQGYGHLRAFREQSKATLLTVLDPESGKVIGGTVDIIDHWTDKENLEKINLRKLLSEFPDPYLTDDSKEITPAGGFSGGSTTNQGNRVIRTMLFSDIAGFSKLREDKYPIFVNEFLKDIGEEINPFQPEPLFINTWGDAIFAVMTDKNAVAMASYATCILNAVQKARKHLPQLNIRIALHAGPVFEAEDSITGNKNYYGSHVNRAARIEPITPPGAIYTSEQFAALLTVQQSQDPKFKFEYMGNLSLAKNFDKQGAYKLLSK
jgi:class 3 adenylate cyclase